MHVKSGKMQMRTLGKAAEPGSHRLSLKTVSICQASATSGQGRVDIYCI